MLNFLKSLVLPSAMSRHRHMSMLISICILVLLCYLFSLPVGYYHINNATATLETADQYEYLEVLVSVPEENEEANEIAAELKEINLHYNDQGNLAVDTEKYDPTNHYSKSFTFQIEVKEYDAEGNETGSHQKDIVMYIMLYFPAEGDETAFLDSEIVKSFNNTPLDDKGYYYIGFTSGTIYYQTGQIVDLEAEGVEYTDEQKAQYNSHQYLSLPFSTQILFTTLALNLENFGDTGASIVKEVANVFSYNITSVNYMMYILFNLLGTFIILPLLISLLFWLFFKKTGHLKKFHEYLNIAAISMLIPAILTFIISWFWISIINISIFIFGVYYIFVIYRINANPEIA